MPTCLACVVWTGRRVLWLGATLCGLAFMQASETAHVVWIYNNTPSVPIGWYRVHRARPVVVGELVAWKMSPSQTSWMQQRRYIAKKVLLIKRVVASRGQRVCWNSNRSVTVQGRIVAHGQSHDNQGRRMPALQGCRVLSGGEYLLLGTHQHSIDGRYLGIAHATELLGVVRPL